MSQTLTVRIYKPQGKPKACIEIVHGMAEHSLRYDVFAKYLEQNGFAVVTYDLPGHGETATGKTLGYFGDEHGWDLLVSSAGEVAKTCRERFPDTPLVLMGHSMGTIICRCYIQKNDDAIDGLILSGLPNYSSSVSLGLILAKIIRFFKGPKGYSKMLDTLVTGNFNSSIENPATPMDWLSVNKENVQRYIADPLCGFPFTIQGYIDELEGLVQMNDTGRYEFHNKTLPIYVFAGQDDPCVGGNEGFQSSIQVLSTVGYQNIAERRYPGMRHETLNENGNETVFKDVISWLDAHYKPSAE